MNHTVLIVDHSGTVRMDLADAFRAAGFVALLCSTSREAREALWRTPARAVILAPVLPDGDSLELVQEVRRSPAGASALVVMLSSEAEVKDRVRGLQRNVDEYVGKPYDVGYVVARVQELLQIRQPSGCRGTAVPVIHECETFREELRRKELDAAEARAARELAYTRAILVEELERKNRELEAFSYSVSHDLRAPLRAVDGFSKALLDHCADALDAEAKGYLEGVRAAAQRMGELIDDLLELSRIGRADLRRVPTSLTEIARSILADLQKQEPDRVIAIEVCDDLTAHADRRLIRIVLENLLGNSWKFTAKAADAAIACGSERRGDGVVYFVRDNGAGFDMAYAEKLFRPFQRLHSAAQFPGTGIGLATVHRIIDRHGGRVWAEGAAGRGATFYFTIPPSRPGGRP